jgi:hypothetical protein
MSIWSFGADQRAESFEDFVDADDAPAPGNAPQPGRALDCAGVGRPQRERRALAFEREVLIIEDSLRVRIATRWVEQLVVLEAFA